VIAALKRGPRGSIPIRTVPLTLQTDRNPPG
jgi:hypothetical protein